MQDEGRAALHKQIPRYQRKRNPAANKMSKGKEEKRKKETRKAQELGESQAQGLVNSEARGVRGMRRQNPAPLKARTAVRSLERDGAKQLYRDVQLGPR